MRKAKLPTFSGLILVEPIMVVAATIMLIAAPILNQREPVTAFDVCTSKQKQLTFATIMYAAENDAIFPGSENIWEDIWVSKDVLKCPVDKSQADISYAYNANLSHVHLGEIEFPETISLVADSEREDTLMTEVADIALRHKRGETVAVIVSFVDGHVSWYSESNIGEVLF